jgi:hypothetical protein
MPAGSHRFSTAEHERAMKIKASLKKRNRRMNDEEAERIAWATIQRDKSKRGGKGFLKR